MQDAAFDRLVQRLEQRARRHPALYEWYVAGLVTLAYVYLLGVLLLAIGLVVGVVALACNAPNPLTIKLAIVIGLAAGGLCVAIIKGLWVRLEPPTGLEITAAEAPELFSLIDQLRGQLRSAPFHQVLLVNDYNAAVAQTPRLGVFGWQRNYLIVGLPLMLGLGPDEFKAVLAHEFGHLRKIIRDLMGGFTGFGALGDRSSSRWRSVAARILGFSGILPGGSGQNSMPAHSCFRGWTNTLRTVVPPTWPELQRQRPP